MVYGKGLGMVRMWVWTAVCTLVLAGTMASAQDFRPTSDRNLRRNDTASLSESTALLEEAIRTMYSKIEPNGETSPNELLAYADLRALRLYTGALEVSGWSLEQSLSDYRRFQTAGAYRNGYNHINDQQAQLAWERYRAYRETSRTLLYRVRTTAVSVEHQVAVCSPEVAHEWRNEVVPILRMTVAAIEPMFEDTVVYQRYGVPGRTAAKIVPTSNTGGIPQDAVEVSKNPQFRPHGGEGRGMGRYFEVRAYGGAVTVKSIRFRMHEQTLGLIGSSSVKELIIDRAAEPGRPLFIACNRGRTVDLSELEIEWETADRGRRSYGTIELVENNPADRR